MIIEKVVDRFMDENTYILGDEKTKKCAVIDPGGSIIDIFNIIKQHGLTVEYIILTHGHGDHICRVPEIKSKTNAKIVAHVNEEEVLIDRNKNLSAQLPGLLVGLITQRSSVRVRPPQLGEKLQVSLFLCHNIP